MDTRPWIVVAVGAAVAGIVYFRNRLRGKGSSDGGGDFSMSSDPSGSSGWFSGLFGDGSGSDSSGGDSGGGGGDGGGGSD